MKFTFSKAERLCSKKTIEALFAGGHKSVSIYPIRAVFMPVPDGNENENNDENKDGGVNTKLAPVNHTQLLISVSKRHFKHAVDRNRVKRQLREAYRLNKHLLLDTLPEGEHLAIAFIWLSDDLFKSDTIQTKVRKLLLRIAEECKTAEENSNVEGNKTAEV